MGRAARRKAERNQSAMIQRQRVGGYQKADPSLLNALCRDCVDFLQAEYPFYAWGVCPSPDGSMIDIVCDAPGISTRHGFSVYTTTVENVTLRRPTLRQAGGEVLERFNLARHKRTEASEVQGQRNTLGQLQPQT